VLVLCTRHIAKAIVVPECGSLFAYITMSRILWIVEVKGRGDIIINLNYELFTLTTSYQATSP